MNNPHPVALKKNIAAAVISGVIACLVTCVHHWYGAMAYDTPWRTEVVYWITFITMIVYSLLYVYWKHIHSLIGKIALWLFVVGAVFLQAGFTLFECVYSHILKDILFFAGTSRAVLEQMYPAPAYHLPDNLLFEITGILQLTGFIAVYFACRLFQAQLKAGEKTSGEM